MAEERVIFLSTMLTTEQNKRKLLSI